jgi:hypothetical protein
MTALIFWQLRRLAIIERAAAEHIKSQQLGYRLDRLIESMK